MTDYRALHLIRDLPPLVEAPGLPGEGGPHREQPSAGEDGESRPAVRTGAPRSTTTAPEA
ncbi:hypothetical protein [Actinacidiphila sp. ITFR-21]|uniref:hypothetical protein n=1 Tax=Actinacidiphila sp. ITFR-21 TaxID=3075199 RepID=UPI00288B14CF|nr:hypothetical protein [Streptomyces sp. ITFR-21]WNI14448.1 hypothetical protein RLT57_02090 [Streptomyces sp. ITFR-21]